MKTLKFNNLSVVVAGQKSATVNAEPQLIANSTTGKFSITSAVSKALGIAVGENVMFMNNLSEVENAIQARHEAVVTFAEDNGLDLATPEGVKAIIAEFGVWFVAKGYAKVDDKGNPIMASLRYTKEDKEKFIKENMAELVENNREALIERNGGQDADVETLGALITVDDIESPKIQDCEGSRTATTGNATGVGCPLNFTDTATWNILKKDLAEKNKVNRTFNVLLDQGMPVNVKNGNKVESFVAYPIEFAKDEAPIVRGEKAE